MLTQRTMKKFISLLDKKKTQANTVISVMKEKFSSSSLKPSSMKGYSCHQPRKRTL